MQWLKPFPKQLQMINLVQEKDGAELQRQDNYVTCH